ncbi:hypothetical protein Strain138_001471 [Pseudogemmatithrix spongiicola]|uniref:Outer membrane protein beta-barrel domain-containing protein n=1 Tax=Pseudogemmatithrix spongiicola TaxID=3062599 RepID=A0AA49JUF4_9BACT|nr:hypothetical protein Strain138_001471 [Gemmatimonadaceae bacterium 'strain 138']WKW15098.1 hypothetical protein Strain318_001471 [Gemmatimonadaceae bacterium 'strain 318']
MTRSLRLAVLLASLVATGCLPYTIGNTAQTTPKGEISKTTTAGFAIGVGGRFADSNTVSPQANLLLSDQEIRFGIDDGADIGLRITSASGLVGNLKRRHSGANHVDSAAFATSIGVGIVNFASHALFEGALHFSGGRRPTGIPYGAVKVMHTVPISRGALRDDPSAGAAFGWRFGDADVSIAPEIAVWYDRPVSGIRTGNVVVVPSITLKGLSFLPRIFR